MPHHENPFPGMNPFLELRWSDAHARLIAYIAKRRHYLSSAVNLVEIDLIRAGRHTVAVDPEALGHADGSHNFICVSRAGQERRHEVYRISYRERIPAFRVPLRPTDPDVPLALQPLVDRCYRTGRYWQVSEPRRIERGFTEDEHRWIAERVETEE